MPEVAPRQAIRQLAEWTHGVERGPTGAVAPPWVILIDGRSGSGKTYFAEHLLAACQIRLATSPLPQHNPQLVHLEDFYPGWGGLFAAATMVAADVLNPNAPGFRRWDWENNTPGRWQQLDPRRPLIIEGIGALSPANLARLRDRGIPHRAVVLDAPTWLRKHRALNRDPYYAPWWDMWAAQERAHIERRPTPHAVVPNY